MYLSDAIIISDTGAVVKPMTENVEKVSLDCLTGEG